MTERCDGAARSAIIVRMLVASIWPMLITLAVVLVAAFVARAGWRWRRVDISPSCARCGYDVSRRPAGVERCSECGADLAGPRAIRTSRRVANRWLAVPATIVGVLAALQFAGTVATFPFVAWAREQAPIAVMQWLARRNHGPTGDPYRVAWQQRAFADGYLDHLLDLQADPAIAWRKPFGDELATALKNGRATDAQRDRFVRQMYGPATFRVRTPVRAGDPLQVSASWTLRGTNGGVGLDTKQSLAARADGTAEIAADRYWSIGFASDQQRRPIAAKDWGGASLAPGPHRVNVKLRRQVISRNGMPPDRPMPIGPAIDDEATLDIEVLSADAPLGKAVFDPAKGDAVAAATSINVFHWHDDRCFAEIRLLPMNTDRAFSIFAVIDGVERHIGGVCARANAEATSQTIYVPLSVERARATDRLTIILVGDGTPLAETIDQQEYWPGRIVYPDVSLRPYADRASGAALSTPAGVVARVEPATRPAGE